MNKTLPPRYNLFILFPLNKVCRKRLNLPVKGLKIHGCTLMLLACIVAFNSCNDIASTSGDKPLLHAPSAMDEKVKENISDLLEISADNKGKIDDSLSLYLPQLVKYFYNKTENLNVWSESKRWSKAGDSLFYFIEHAKYFGLFPDDYHYSSLLKLRQSLNDSVQSSEAGAWSKADVLLTDGWMRMLKHVKQGRLLPDSLSLSADSAMADSFFTRLTFDVIKQNNFSATFKSLEPKHHGYYALKNAIPRFLDSMDQKKYTYVVYPNKDSIALVKNVQKRLFEGGFISFNNKTADSATFAGALKKFQKKKNLTADGKIGATTVRSMNTSDLERFKRIAITLDRYKQLTASLPEKYIWVNLPGYYLKVWDHDTIAIESRVIVGKPYTRTPTLNSEISDMVTFPKWTIPASIIKKDILPALKRNPGYLARRGFSLVNNKGGVVNPYSVNWAKYTSGIPFQVQQGSGDDNALGILKFNFDNPYSVYLHDTNQRYLFKNKDRALSHGCVRVQEWEKLAYYIARNDSINKKPGDSLKYTADSLKRWLANKERKRVVVKNRLPLFIRYFTCEGKDGKVVFYDDIYGEDKKLREQYFNN